MHLSMQESQVPSLGWEGPPEKEMATHSSILAWKIPWMEEPRRLQSMYLFKLSSLTGCYRIVRIVLGAIQYVLVDYLFYI